MVNIRFMISLLSIFIATIVLVVFLQYSSNSNINNLITGNQELLTEFVMKGKIQDFIEDLTAISTEERKIISRNVRRGRETIDDRMKIVLNDLAYLKKIAVHEDSKQKLNELDQELHAMLQCYNRELDLFYKDVHARPEVLLAYGKEDTLENKIIAISNYLSTSKDDHLINLIQLADQHAKEAKKWGITLAILAIIASIYAFWYINKKVTVQSSLIHQLNESERKVKEAARIKENFMANMSHEIRTPMNAILGFIHLLQKQDLNAKSKEFINAIKNSSENLLTIINDILDFSKIEAGMMRIESSHFSLRELLHSVLAMFFEKAKDKGILLYEETDESIPEILNGDAVRLTQILVNLIGNALKFTAAGKIEIVVSNCKQEGDTIDLSFSIKDTGIGISANKIENVFERFNQADEDTTRKYGGTGLGLAIVKQLVELQNGSISVNSEEGKGSQFIFIIPYKKIQPEALYPENFAQAGNGTLLFNKAINVLVVEDNVMNQNLMKHLLTEWNMPFSIAQNGADAIKKIKESQFDLILMDIQMPEMNGYMATRIIRDDLQLTIPIVALTAHAMAGEREKCLSSGMNDYVSKPINEKELYKIIETLTVQQIKLRQEVPVSSKQVFSTIDLKYLQELSAGKKSFQKDITEQFIIELPLELQAMEIAFMEENYEECKHIAHNLKTSVSFMGLSEKLDETLSYLEDHVLQEKNSAAINGHYNVLKSILQKALEEAKVFQLGFVG